MLDRLALADTERRQQMDQHREAQPNARRRERQNLENERSLHSGDPYQSPHAQTYPNMEYPKPNRPYSRDAERSNFDRLSPYEPAYPGSTYPSPYSTHKDESPSAYRPPIRNEVPEDVQQFDPCRQQENRYQTPVSAAGRGSTYRLHDLWSDLDLKLWKCKTCGFRNQIPRHPNQCGICSAPRISSTRNENV